MQTLIRAIYPPQCLICQALVQDEFGLCGPCWRGFRFLCGVVCDTCGEELACPAQQGAPQYCSTCCELERPWNRGRAALEYSGSVCQFINGLKHRGRENFFRPAARWMVPYARELIEDDTVIVPIPLHWSRMLKRRYNQAAGLARHLAKLLECPLVTDGLIRTRMTVPQNTMDFATRFKNQNATMKLNPRARLDISKGSVLLLDDVMTSGATLSAAASACKQAGVKKVFVLALARVSISR